MVSKHLSRIDNLSLANKQKSQETGNGDWIMSFVADLVKNLRTRINMWKNPSIVHPQIRPFPANKRSHSAQLTFCSSKKNIQTKFSSLKTSRALMPKTSTKIVRTDS